MLAPSHPGILVPTILALSLAACSPTGDAASPDVPQAASSPSPYLYVWAGDADAAEGDTDFLLAVDADPASPAYGSVIGSAPVGSVGNDPHHAELVAPKQGLLFANGFFGNRTFLFDLSFPAHPEFVRELHPVPGYAYAHSFYRLASGHVVATFQSGDESRSGEPGGLAEFDAEGGFLRMTSAADPAYTGDRIRPYSGLVLPEVDRVLTTNVSMKLEPTEDVVQLWRLSDLTLLATLPLPPLPATEGPECTVPDIFHEEDCSPSRVPGQNSPFEMRQMPDGSVLLNTVACGFYRIHALDTDEPQVDAVLNWPETVGCAVPTVVGTFEVLPNMVTNEIVTLDVSDPMAPVEVARIALNDGFMAHWAQVDPGTNRVAVTGIGPKNREVKMYRVDMETGQLTPDAAFGQADGSGGRLLLTREEWPHGPTGPAVPHAAFFGR